MPAGSAPAGSSPAGVDLADPLAPPPAPLVDSPYIDPGAQDTIQLDDGSVEQAHWVDAQVMLAFAITKGTLASVPSDGQSLSQIAYLRASLEAEVKDSVRQTLARLLTRGDIEIVSITVDQQIQGGFLATIAYRNLRVLGSRPRVLSRSIS